MSNAAHTEAAPAIGEAVAIALNAEGDAWIMLVPAGGQVRGRDGRTFKNPDPHAVVAAFAKEGRAVPIDINHAQFLKAPAGEESPAAGWIEELEVRDGAIWGCVEWTKIGLNALGDKSYRYISPALIAPGETIIGIAGAGLVNRPNFNMPALNSEEEPTAAALAEKLGLPAGASLGDIVAAVDALKRNAATPEALALAVEQRDKAVADLNARLEAERQAEATTLVEQAVKDGKIAPATKGDYLALCASRDGLEAVKCIIAKQVSFFAKSGLDDRPPGAVGDGVALNAQLREIAEKMGTSHEAIAAVVAEQESANAGR
jgi:phage I-like protein